VNSTSAGSRLTVALLVSANALLALLLVGLYLIYQRIDSADDSSANESLHSDTHAMISDVSDQIDALKRDVDYLDSHCRR
jgi:hypothetical protein